MNLGRFWRSFLAGVVVALGSTVALAQDYTVTAVTGQWATPPSSASNFGLTGDDATKTLDSTNGFPPFDINFYGRTFQSTKVGTNGFLNFSLSTASGCCSPSSGPFATGNSYDGICAAAWTDLNGVTVGTSTPTIWTWTDGTAPYRRFVIAWTNWSRYGTNNGNMNFQVQFYETTGRIIMAYTGNWTASSTYGVCIDEYQGSRFTRPPAPGSTSGLYTFTNNAPNDWQFDPNITEFRGSVFMDAFVPGPNGIPTSPNLTGVPLAGMGAELRNASGQTLASATVDQDGNYLLAGLALPSSSAGSIHVAASSSSCRIIDASGVPYSTQIASSVPFGSATTIPTFTLNAATDPNQTMRKASQIASAIGRANAYMRTRTTANLGRVDVRYDDVSVDTSRYIASPLSIRIGGTASGNPDAYDPGVVTRVYSRYLLRMLAGATTASSVTDLDTPSDANGALADALGCYIRAMNDGASTEVDGISSSSAKTFNFETPTLFSAKSPVIGGWVSAAFYDLVDAANETHDTIDGTIDSDATGGIDANRPLEVFLRLTRLDMTDYVYEWANRGYDSVKLTQNFIYHGVLSDDADEANDTFATARDIGTAGVLRKRQRLNSFNEDWYRIDTAATTGFIVDVVYNRSLTTAQVLLEIQASTGTVLATGAYNVETASMRAVTGAIGPSTLYIRVAHVGGGFLGDYDLQAFGRLSVRSTGPTEWTVNHALSQPLEVLGGIPPFKFSVKPPATLPPGLLLDATNFRVFGTPIEVGSLAYDVTTTDSGAPGNSFLANLSLTVNPELTFKAPAFNGIARGKQTDISLGRSGGTNPIVVTDLVGDLPEGLTLTEDFRIQGVTNEDRGGLLAFKATDLAGSQALVSTTLVPCAKAEGGRIALSLASGEANNGLFFDVVSDTTASITVTTAKKKPKRSLSVLVVGPDGSAVQGGTVTSKPGRLQIRNMPLPLTGRYFVILSSNDGGAESSLTANVKLALPKGGGGELEFDFGETDEFTFGALEGASFAFEGKTTLDMEIRVVSIIRPDGTLFPADQVTEQQGKGKFSFRTHVDQSGTWKLTFAPKPGPVGELKYTYSIKQPKNGDYSVD